MFAVIERAVFHNVDNYRRLARNPMLVFYWGYTTGDIGAKGVKIDKELSIRNAKPLNHFRRNNIEQ